MVPCGMRVCFTRRLVWKEIFSVLRRRHPILEEVVFGGGEIRGGSWRSGAGGKTRALLSLLRGEHDGLVGIDGFFTLFAAGEVAIDGDAGAKLFGTEQGFQCRVDLGQEVRFDFLPVFEAGFVLRRVVMAALRGRLSRAPRLSTRVTASGERPSTAPATRLTMALMFWPESFEPGLI